MRLKKYLICLADDSIIDIIEAFDADEACDIAMSLGHRGFYVTLTPLKK